MKLLIGAVEALSGGANLIGCLFLFELMARVSARRDRPAWRTRPSPLLRFGVRVRVRA